MQNKETRCRHRDAWLIGGGAYEWCYRCGAIRSMRETGIAQVTPMSPWCKPVGPRPAVNPWGAWNVQRTTYQLRARDAKSPADTMRAHLDTFGK